MICDSFLQGITMVIRSIRFIEISPEIKFRNFSFSYYYISRKEGASPWRNRMITIFYFSIKNSGNKILKFFELKNCSQGRIRTFTGCHYSSHIIKMLFYPQCYNHPSRLPGLYIILFRHLTVSYQLKQIP